MGDVMRIMNAAFDPAYGEAWSAAQCAGALSTPGATLLLARSGETVSGFALARTVFEETELLLLAVCPRQRGRGVARALIARLFEDLASRGVVKLFLEVRENNSARGFYSATGFSEVGFRKNYYRGTSGIYTNAVTLTLNLPDLRR